MEFIKYFLKKALMDFDIVVEIIIALALIYGSFKLEELNEYIIKDVLELNMSYTESTLLAIAMLIVELLIIPLSIYINNTYKEFKREKMYEEFDIIKRKGKK